MKSVLISQHLCFEAFEPDAYQTTISAADAAAINEALAFLDADTDADAPSGEGKIATKTEALSAAETPAGWSSPVRDLEACPVSFTPSPLTPSPLPASTSSTPKSLKPTWTPPLKTWKRASGLDHTAQAFESAEKRGGLAVTVNLTAKRQDELLNCRDPARVLSQAIERAMRDAFGDVLPFAFRFELSPRGFLHFHGVIIPGRHQEIAIRECFRVGVGKMRHKFAARQADTRKLYDAADWVAVGYLTKNIQQTMHYLGTTKIDFVSSGLKRIAQNDWYARGARK